MRELIYNSIADDDVIKRFGHQMGKTLMQNAFNTCSIEQFLSVASVLWPALVEVDGCIFVRDFYTGGFSDLVRQFSGDRQKIERFVNTWSLGEFFLLSRDNSVDDDVIFDEFCKVVEFFWKLRVRELFPDRNIVVETGWELEGESGLAITLYQKD